MTFLSFKFNGYLWCLTLLLSCHVNYVNSASVKHNAIATGTVQENSSERNILAPSVSKNKTNENTVLKNMALTGNTLKIGIIDYPPHIDTSAQIDASPLLNYVSALFTTPGLKVEFFTLPSGRAHRELNKGSVDLLMPVDQTLNTQKTLSTPIFHATPGLCFRKENFIPILSATHRLNGLTIGVPSGTQTLPVLKSAGAVLVPLKGLDATKRGIDLTQRGRIDAAYHASPITVYHSKNPVYKELACSYFHGYSSPKFIGVSPTLSNDTVNRLNNMYLKAIKLKSYEFYFAQRDVKQH